MESISVSCEVGGVGGASSYSALKRIDQLLSNICSANTVLEEIYEVVSNRTSLFSNYDLASKAVESFDVLVCGGTLGIFFATTLCFKGLRVGIVERNILQGREQECNISRRELLELVEVGIVAEEDIEQATDVGSRERGIFGLKIFLILVLLRLSLSTLKQRFTSLGGVIYEGCSLSNISIYDETAVVQLDEGNILSSQLVIDAMGSFSPVLRHGRKPDGVCIVVGSCARDFIDNPTSGVIFSSSSIKKIGDSSVQYFWEVPE